MTVLESIWGVEDAKKLPKGDAQTMENLERKFGQFRIGKGKCAIKIRPLRGGTGEDRYEVEYTDGKRFPARLYRLVTHVDGFLFGIQGKATHMGQAKYILVVGSDKDDPQYRENGLTSAMVQARRSFSTMDKRMQENSIDPVDAKLMAGELWKTMDRLKKNRQEKRTSHEFDRESWVPLDEWMKNLSIAPAHQTIERECEHQFRNGVLSLDANRDFEKEIEAERIAEYRAKQQLLKGPSVQPIMVIDPRQTELKQLEDRLREYKQEVQGLQASNPHVSFIPYAAMKQTKLASMEKLEKRILELRHQLDK